MAATLLILAMFILYFLPTFISAGKRNAGAIFTLNLLLGWTFIGWVTALVWALMKEEPQDISPRVKLEEVITVGPPRLPTITTENFILIQKGDVIACSNGKEFLCNNIDTKSYVVYGERKDGSNMRWEYADTGYDFGYDIVKVN